MTRYCQSKGAASVIIGHGNGKGPRWLTGPPSIPVISVARKIDMDRCNHCKQALIDIDNRGERLAGCLSCNLWSCSGEKLWIRLSEEDLRALHLLRHGGAAKQMPKPHRAS
jgi:hypothetical protein